MQAVHQRRSVHVVPLAEPAGYHRVQIPDEDPVLLHLVHPLFLDHVSNGPLRLKKKTTHYILESLAKTLYFECELQNSMF